MSFGATLTNEEDGDFGDGDFFCVEAIVARNDDPENRCRVQVVVPVIDEDEIHEIWARRFGLYVGENGFGDYFVPALGAEVLVIGRLGDTNHLFYAPLWNESRLPSIDFPDPNVFGIRVPGVLKFIAGQLMQLKADVIEAVAAQVAKIIAPNIEITAEQLAKVKGNNATIEATAQAQLKGATVKLDGSGNVQITGGNVQITGSTIKLFNRTVSPTGPPI